MHEVYTIFHKKAKFVKRVNRFNAELFHKNCVSLKKSVYLESIQLLPAKCVPSEEYVMPSFRGVRNGSNILACRSLHVGAGELGDGERNGTESFFLLGTGAM